MCQPRILGTSVVAVVATSAAEHTVCADKIHYYGQNKTVLVLRFGETLRTLKVGNKQGT